MSALDNIKALLRTNGHVEAQTKETLIKCFEQLLAGTGEITSPLDTIDITAGNPTIVDVNGQPPTNGSTDLGSVSRRWNALWLPTDGIIRFSAGPFLNSNTISYTNAVGPVFFDRITTKSLIFDVQDFTANNTATWQDSSGTVAWLTDLLGGVGVQPVTEGATIVLGGFAPAAGNHLILTHTGGLTDVTFQINDGDSTTYGCTQWIGFNCNVTNLHFSGSNWSTAGFALPTSATANVPFAIAWDDGSSTGTPGWIRFH